VPAVAALGGVMLSRMRGDDRVCRHVRWTMMATGVALTVAGASVLYVFETADGVYALKGTMAVSILAMLGGALATVFAIRYRPWKSAVVVVAAVIVVDWVFVVRVLPDFERYKPVVPMSDTIARRLVPGDIVAHYQVALPSMVYYLRRHVDQYFDEQPFLDAMASRRRVYAVLSEGDYDALRPRLGSACVIERRPTFDVKLRNILSREPPPELLLITNDCRQ
jgi:hypothetical protein